MALGATIYKAELNIADMDRHYYDSHHLTLAQHPSETTERLMLRVLSFAFNAVPELQFTKGLSTDDEPDLWQKNYSDEIELWIDLGQPSEKRIRKACGRSKHVIIYSYGDKAGEVWWQQTHNKLERFNNLSVFHIGDDVTEQLASLNHRTMILQCNIQDQEITISDDQQSISFTLTSWLS